MDAQQRRLAEAIFFDIVEGDHLEPPELQSLFEDSRALLDASGPSRAAASSAISGAQSTGAVETDDDDEVTTYAAAGATATTQEEVMVARSAASGAGAEVTDEEPEAEGTLAIDAASGAQSCGVRDDDDGTDVESEGGKREASMTPDFEEEVDGTSDDENVSYGGF